MSGNHGTKPTDSGVSTDRANRREDIRRRNRRIRRAHRYDWRGELRDAAVLLSARRGLPA